MLQSTKNKLTMSILTKLRDQGSPSMPGIEPIPLMGEADETPPAEKKRKKKPVDQEEDEQA